MSTDERPLSSLAAKDLFNYMEQIKISFTATAQTEIAATVRTEISAAIAPLHASQREIVEELESTKLKVSEIADDNADTKAKVSELQEQMILMQHQLTKSSTLPVPPNPSTTGRPQVPPIHHPSTSTDRHSAAALEVIHNARKILGFSPITPDDISYLKAQNNMNDDTEAKSVAIIEFLNCEMKVPKSFTDQLIMKRIFPPSRHPTEWKTLYVEFEDTSITDLINQYVTNLLPGKSVSIYVPHSLFPRFSAVRDIEHSYRNGDIKHKTKVKYGPTDFALLAKPRHERAPWFHVSLSSLPPLKLSVFDGNPSSSPPPGRARLSSKRSRSESSETEDNRVNKQKVDSSSDNPNANKETDDADTEVHENPDNLLKTPSKDDPVLPINRDLGSFHPSACLSPSAAQNLNFNFASKSGIPLMKNHLNC